MTKAPLAPYPALRMRRLRQADWSRRLVRETVLTPNDLIWSLVVHDGAEPEIAVPVSAMPGEPIDYSVKREAAKIGRCRLKRPGNSGNRRSFRFIDGAEKGCGGRRRRGIRMAWSARAIKAMKEAAPEVGIHMRCGAGPLHRARS